MYDQPGCNYDMTRLPLLLWQLLKPFLLLGDIYCHSPFGMILVVLWKASSMLHFYAVLMMAHQLFTACCILQWTIDLPFTSADAVSHVQWSVIADHFSGDHHLIMLSHSEPGPSSQLSRYNLSTVNWLTF